MPTNIFLTIADDLAGQTRNDAGEDQQRNAVADALVIDALANPHGQSGTTCQAQADGHIVVPGRGGAA